MYRKVEDFLSQWDAHYHETLKVFEQLTDDALSTAVADEHRTLARIAWHIVLTIPEMSGEIGLQVQRPDAGSHMPKTVAEFCDAYRKAAASLAAQIETSWSDDTLLIEDQLYGETWKRGFTLWALLAHEVHHRGQMTVLMRQAGLRVPGTYGPSQDEWANMGMAPPAV